MLKGSTFATFVKKKYVYINKQLPCVMPCVNIKMVLYLYCLCCIFKEVCIHALSKSNMQHFPLGGDKPQETTADY